MKKIVLWLIVLTAAIQLAAAPRQNERIVILGSCAGTEPMPQRHHTAWTLESKGKLYQFDAGEGCGYTAHLNNIDLTNLHAIFISHPHPDHTAGLAHLLYVRGKVARKYRKTLAVKPLPVYTPVVRQIEALLDFISGYSNYRIDYRKNNFLSIHQVKDGVIFDDQTIKVEALHNLHMKQTKNNQWSSYSYRITVNGKKIVYSGDVKNVNDLDKFLSDCDILLMENGHIKPWITAETIRKNPRWNVRRLIFVHNGRAVLNTPEETQKKTNAAWGKKVEIAHDGMVIAI